eukprot:TRINITY_DN9327_c0_g1_i1.p1 TRINITY_DN9327_c0_g1~~TRINITY_DN9327_c0_g1_i1.p1  ORF type:complete len:165 (+),score=19.32 TRINITY_DN9327_c0_g1_i1:135-629(+)
MGTCCTSGETNDRKPPPGQNPRSQAAQAREEHQRRNTAEIQEALQADLTRISKQLAPSSPVPHLETFSEQSTLAHPSGFSAKRDVPFMTCTVLSQLDPVEGIDETCSCYIQAVAPFLSGTHVCVGLGVATVAGTDCRDMKLDAVVELLTTSPRPLDVQLSLIHI